MIIFAIISSLGHRFIPHENYAGICTFYLVAGYTEHFPYLVLPYVSQGNSIYTLRSRKTKNMLPLNLKWGALHRFRSLEKFSYGVTRCVDVTLFNNFAYIAGQHFSMLEVGKQ